MGAILDFIQEPTNANLRPPERSNTSQMVFTHCGRVRWRVCGGAWVVAMEWRESAGDPQVFRFIGFYGSLYSRVFPRS